MNYNQLKNRMSFIKKISDYTFILFLHTKTKLPYMLQSEHKNKLNFCLHKHHLLFVRLARICFLQYTPKDMLLADENRVAPRFRQSTSLKYAVRFSVHCWYLL